MEFKLCLCTVSLLIVCRTHKIMIVSSAAPHKGLPLLSRDVLSDEDELHYLSILYPDDHELDHGCQAAYFGAKISDQPGSFGGALSESNLKNGNLKVNASAEIGHFDLIIFDEYSLPSKSRISCWKPTPILFLIHDKVVALPADYIVQSSSDYTTLSELPSKSFTERFNAIKQLIKYLISLYKQEGATRVHKLMDVLARRGRLDALQYSTRSHSYIEQYNVDVWCCVLTIIALLAGTALYLVTIIILHILEKSRIGARIM